MNEEIGLIYIFVLVYIMASSLVFYRLYCIRPPTTSHEEEALREASHKISNESSQIRAKISEIKKKADQSKDPFDTLSHMLTGKH